MATVNPSPGAAAAAAAATAPKANLAIEHPLEPKGNQWRRRLAQTEPVSLRTYTPSLAVITKSSGVFHWTADDRKLMDFTSGVLVANLGHNPTSWWRRVLNYMGLSSLPAQDRYMSSVPLTAYNAVTELEVQACEQLLKLMRGEPGGRRMEQVMWAASGSEAIQKALWAAMKRRPGRDMVLATRRGFHGKKGLAGAVTGTEHDPDRDPRVRFISFPTDECIDIDRRNEPLDLAPYARELEQAKKEIGDRLCAVITEPYLGGGGSFHPQPQYLQLLERFCRENDLVFILDEIQSNFGRTGPMFAYTRYGVEPDIVCLGKGLGNGIPVSAAVGRADVLGSLKYGEGSDTWSANPLSCAAVLATIEEFAATGAIYAGEQVANFLERGLRRLKDNGLVKYVRGEGAVWGVECAGFGSHSPEKVAIECVRACYIGNSYGEGIHLLGPLAGKVIRVSPPLILSYEDSQYYLDLMYEFFTNVRKRLS